MNKPTYQPLSPGIPVRFVADGDKITVFGHIKGRPFEQTAYSEIALGLIVFYLIKKNSE